MTDVAQRTRDDIVDVEPVEEDEATGIEEVASAELAIREEREQVTKPAANVLPSPGEWDATLAVAEKIAKTTFVPKAYRGQPEAVVAGILYGREIGLGPMQALQKVHIIDGKPSLAAEEMLAQMRRGGVVILASESTSERAMIHARRSDTGEEATVEWTLQDAIDAGLTGKDNWAKYRIDMLWARCVGRLCRRLGSDLVGGMVYAAEEMQDWDAGGYDNGAIAPATITNPNSKDFQPDFHLAAGAPAGWDQIQELILDLDHELADWIAEAVLTLYGTTIKVMTDDDQRKRAGRRIANALTVIRDTLFKDGDFPPPTDDEYRKVFAWAFDGIRVEGPEPYVEAELDELDEEALAAAEADTSEAPVAASGGQESDADVEPVQDSLPEAENGSQGHVGTGEPDL